jgi:signal transduction histidine kinase
VLLVVALLACVLAAVLAVRLVRDRREHAARLQELTTGLQRERERGERVAAAEEQARIARELHEVVARALALIATHANTAQGLLEAEPERARRPLREIHRSAEEALGELRRLHGMLGGEEQLGLAQLPALIERARAGGMPVTLHIEGEPRHVSAALDLSAYRIVQEALANVHKHARGAPATVHVVWERGALALQVRDAGVTDHRPERNDDGHGLVGIRERVRLHGGELEAGRVAGGGFEVKAVLPL